MLRSNKPVTDATDPTDISPLVTDAAVRESPPSCKLVWVVLDRDGQATQKALIERTGMSPRTIRYALSRLIDAGAIEEHVYPKDARQSLYSISE